MIDAIRGEQLHDVTALYFDYLQYGISYGSLSGDTLEPLKYKLSGRPTLIHRCLSYATLGTTHNTEGTTSSSMSTSTESIYGTISYDYIDNDCCSRSNVMRDGFVFYINNQRGLDSLALDEVVFDVIYVYLDQNHVSGACAAYYVHYLLPRRWTLYKRINLK